MRRIYNIHKFLLSSFFLHVKLSNISPHLEDYWFARRETELRLEYKELKLKEKGPNSTPAEVTRPLQVKSERLTTWQLHKKTLPDVPCTHTSNRSFCYPLIYNCLMAQCQYIQYMKGRETIFCGSLRILPKCHSQCSVIVSCARRKQMVLNNDEKEKPSYTKNTNNAFKSWFSSSSLNIQLKLCFSIRVKIHISTGFAALRGRNDNESKTGKLTFLIGRASSQEVHSHMGGLHHGLPSHSICLILTCNK